MSIKLCFVSVNGPREPYLLDEPLEYFSTENLTPSLGALN
jgi:hypothetical protein